MRAVIVPGNGCDGDVRSANWYGWLERRLEQDGRFDGGVHLKTMPDPIQAKREYPAAARPRFPRTEAGRGAQVRFGSRSCCLPSAATSRQC